LGNKILARNGGGRNVFGSVLQKLMTSTGWFFYKATKRSVSPASRFRKLRVAA